jgi:hypothetical protein
MNLNDVKGNGRGLFEFLSQHLNGRTEEDHENLSQNSRCSGRDLNLGPPKYDAVSSNHTVATFSEFVSTENITTSTEQSNLIFKVKTEFLYII